MSVSETSSPKRGRIALAMGCPAGVAPELTARMLVDQEVLASSEITVFGDRRVLDYGARVAGVAPVVTFAEGHADIPDAGNGPVFVDIGHLDPATIPVGEVSLEAGRFAITNFSRALKHAQDGRADVVAFTPFNKAAMRLAHPTYEDEIVFLSEQLQFTGAASEFNVLPALWNARVTSHVPIGKVAPLITRDNVLRSLLLTDKAMRESGFGKPRIGVAGLNPHAGDGGNFGREEIDEIEPAVKAGQAAGIDCDGPYPSDTVFVRAQKGQFDAVLTMYHDQGQIAMKLIGFDQGVTLLGGFPFPLVTAAHGSAYDIAGKGIAHPGAMHNAMMIGSRTGASRRSAIV